MALGGVRSFAFSGAQMLLCAAPACFSSALVRACSLLLLPSTHTGVGRLMGTCKRRTAVSWAAVRVLCKGGWWLVLALCSAFVLVLGWADGGCL